jgi:hypothetical protein
VSVRLADRLPQTNQVLLHPRYVLLCHVGRHGWIELVLMFFLLGWMDLVHSFLLDIGLDVGLFVLKLMLRFGVYLLKQILF